MLTNKQTKDTLQIELSKLQMQNKDLLELNRSLLAQNSELNSRISSLSSIEQEKQQLLFTIAEKNTKIELLEQDKTLILKQKDIALRELDMKYIKEISSLKNQNENNIQKVENATIALKLNEKQHEYILDLENQIKLLTQNESEKYRQVVIEHENQFTMLKKKMMDHIRISQKNSLESNLNNQDLNNKISKLTTNQLLQELEWQSLQIEELIKKKEKYEKDIFRLETEMEMHRKVEQVLQEKNKKYLGMVRACDRKITHKKNEEQIVLTDINSPVKTNLITYKNYEKMYNKLLIEYNNLKNNYETLRDKEKYFQNKFSGIINLYQMAIDDLLQDEEIKKAKIVNVNINDIRNGNFDNYTKEEKYSILVYLIKNLLPLMDPEENKKIEMLKDQFSNVDINTIGEKDFFLNKMNSRVSKFKQTKNGINNKSQSFNANKTFNKFPKIEHLVIGSNKEKNNPLYKFLNIK